MIVREFLGMCVRVRGRRYVHTCLCFRVSICACLTWILVYAYVRDFARALLRLFVCICIIVKGEREREREREREIVK